MYSGCRSMPFSRTVTASSSIPSFLYSSARGTKSLELGSFSTLSLSFSISLSDITLPIFYQIAGIKSSSDFVQPVENGVRNGIFAHCVETGTALPVDDHDPVRIDIEAG